MLNINNDLLTRFNHKKDKVFISIIRCDNRLLLIILFLELYNFDEISE